MTRSGLVAILPQGAALPSDLTVRFESVAQRIGMNCHRLVGGACLATWEPARLGTRAAFIGEVFAPIGDQPTTLPDFGSQFAEETGSVAAPGPWGDFVAIEGFRERRTQIFRPPFGKLPCFWMSEGDYVLAATSVPLLEAFAARRPAIDWRQLALFLLSPQMRNGTTCLSGVHELQGGSMLEVSGDRIAVRARWSPWNFARSSCPLETLNEAAELVGAAIDHAVTAQCASLTNPVLLLSGGLDSSTIAAALAASGCTFSSLNMVTHHASGDERRYARAVADRTGSPLTECLRATADIDWCDTTPRRLARPSSRLFRQPTFKSAQVLVQANGADTIIHGGGGDDLFCSLQSVVPILDRYATEGLSPGTWQTARDLALRADTDLLTVLAKTARRKLSRRVAYQWPTITHFLTPDVQALTGEAARHPWLNPPPDTLPGQAAHVALVLDTLALSEDDSLDPNLRTLSPLVAQPVIEAALRVRSWLWFDDGRNRAVIRRAYADRLPAAVIERSGKGTPTGFVAEIVEAHREHLRDLLLDGLLVARGLADPVAIEAVLSDSAIARDDRLGHLLVMSDGERWARLWS